jgi:hypothetical protein
MPSPAYTNTVAVLRTGPADRSPAGKDDCLPAHCPSVPHERVVTGLGSTVSGDPPLDFLVPERRSIIL